MKILYIITKSNWGGAQRNVFDLAEAMKNKGHTVIVALGGEGILRKKLEDIGVKTYSIAGLNRDISINKDAGSFKEIYGVIKREKPDILHLHSPKASGLGALAGRLLRIPLIVSTVHGWTFNENRSIGQKIVIGFFSWLTVILTHKTIVLSQKEYNQGIRFPFVKDRLSIIPLGIKAPTFMSIDGAKQTIGKQIGIDLGELNKKVVVGTIAELHPNKGLNYLIDSMEQVVREHPECICIIIGDGEEASALHLQIKEKKLENNVFLTGYIENAPEYLKALNIFVLPSLKEGFPYVILESAYASMPVIATTVGGVPEMVEDMKSGVLVQPKNSRELSHALSYMIEHPVMRKQYGSALREATIQNFPIEKMIGSLERVYSEKNN